MGVLPSLLGRRPRHPKIPLKTFQNLMYDRPISGAALRGREESMTQKPLVYVVDDEPEMHSILRSWLEPEYEHTEFHRGDEFLGALSKRAPDLIIMDLILPGVDGLELCRQVRSTPGREHVPVLFLTGSHEHSDYLKNFSAGGNGFITKPVSRPQLMAAVGDLLEERQVIVRSSADTGGGD